MTCSQSVSAEPSNVPNPNSEAAQRQFYTSLRSQVEHISPALVKVEYLP